MEELKKEGEVSNKVTLERKEFDAIVDRLNKLEHRSLADMVEEVGQDEVTEHFAFMRIVDEKLVTNLLSQVYGDGNKTDGLFLDLELFDGKATSKKTVHYYGYLDRSPRIKVKILEEKKEKVVRETGSVRATPTDTRVKNFVSVPVKLKEISYNYEYEVEVMEGQYVGLKLTVKPSVLN